MSARSKFNKKSAPGIQPAEVESTDAAQIDGTEDNTEIESPVEMAGTEGEVNDLGDPEIVPDSNTQTEEPISEMIIEQAAEAIETEVNAPATIDPEPESSPNEGHNVPLVADTAPVATTPVTEAGDATVASTSGGRDPRLPPVGSVITRRYKDRDLHVTVLESGFEFEGHAYKSLSKLAGIISGQVCNGYAFFKLTGTSGAAASKAPKATRQVGKPSGDKLAEKITKIDALIVKLRAALDEGAAALAEAEAKRAEMLGTVETARITVEQGSQGT
jgi:hypothetical protein